MLVHMCGVCECVCISIYFRSFHSFAIEPLSGWSDYFKYRERGEPPNPHTMCRCARHTRHTKLKLRYHRYVNTSLAPYSMCLLRLTKLTKAKKKTALYVLIVLVHPHTHPYSSRNSPQAYGYGSIRRCCQLDA